MGHKRQKSKRGLSLRHPGVTVNTLHFGPDTEVMDPVYRQRVLDVLVCFYDMGSCHPCGIGKIMWKAWTDAVATQKKLRPIYFPQQ